MFNNYVMKVDKDSLQEISRFTCETDGYREKANSHGVALCNTSSQLIVSFAGAVVSLDWGEIGHSYWTSGLPGTGWGTPQIAWRTAPANV